MTSKTVRRPIGEPKVYLGVAKLSIQHSSPFNISIRCPSSHLSVGFLLPFCLVLSVKRRLRLLLEPQNHVEKPLLLDAPLEFVIFSSVYGLATYEIDQESS